MKTIPKTIHYCWFGQKPLPELALKCIASWRKFLPNFEIKEWNENNFNVNQIPYTAQAYQCGKFAFVSDYARFKIMHEQGGVYFDTDVEIIKPMEKIITKGPFFGLESSKNKLFCNPGLGFASTPNLELCKEMIDYYIKEPFLLSNGKYNLKTVVQIFSNILRKKGFTPTNDLTEFKGLFFYPPEYFCPMNYHTGETNITPNTYTIHHYAGSWVNENDNPSKIVKIWKALHLPDTDIRGKISKLLKNKSCPHH